MSDMGESLMAAVLADPGGDAPRMVYADWLDEHGQCDRAEFVRVQCALACYPRAPVGLSDGFAAGRWRDGLEALHRRERELLDSADEGDELPHRIRWLGTDNPSYTLEAALRPVFRRGFVYAITCTAADWLAYGDAVLAAQPAEEVTLTTWPPGELGERRIRDAFAARWPRVKAWHLPGPTHGAPWQAGVGQVEKVRQMGVSFRTLARWLGHR